MLAFSSYVLEFSSIFCYINLSLKIYHGHPLLPLNNYACSSFHFLIPQAVARLSTNKPGIWWIQMLRCFSLHIIMRMRWYGQNISILSFVLWGKKWSYPKCTTQWNQTWICFVSSFILLGLAVSFHECAVFMSRAPGCWYRVKIR